MGTKIHTEKILGISILTWTGWDEIGDDWLQFYECEFFLPELEKYNQDKLTASLNRNGDLQIYFSDTEMIELNVGSLKSFRDKLNIMYTEGLQYE